MTTTTPVGEACPITQAYNTACADEPLTPDHLVGYAVFQLGSQIDHLRDLARRHPEELRANLDAIDEIAQELLNFLFQLKNQNF